MNQNRHEESRLEAILACSRLGTWEWNVQTGETLFNERWAEIAGYSLAELSPVSIKTWEKLAHPDDLVESNNLLKRHFTGELPFYDFECRMKHKNGHWVWVRDRGKIFSWTENGQPLLMLGSHEDITERKCTQTQLKDAETALRKSNERLRDAQYLADIGSFTWELETGRVTWSEGMYRLLRYNPSQTIDIATINEAIHHPDDLERVNAWLSQGIQSNAVHLEPNEYRLVRKDGSTIPVRTNVRIERVNGQARRLHRRLFRVRYRQCI